LKGLGFVLEPAYLLVEGDHGIEIDAGPELGEPCADLIGLVTDES
jgi:hypothetical protein